MHRSSHVVRIARSVWWVATAVAGLVPLDGRAQAPGSAGLAVRGIVLTTDAAPVAGATVTLTPTGQPAQAARAVVTAEDGMFAFPGSAAGPAVLHVRRLGFGAESLLVTVPPPVAEPLAIQLWPVPQALAPVIIRDTRDRGPIADFYRRRERGFGRYITRADIERRRPLRTTDLLRTVAGVAVEDNGPTARARIRGSHCAPELYIDGTPTGPVAFDLNAIHPGSVEGIEIYSSSATVPVEFRRPFGRAACGTVLIWTRRGERRPRRPKTKPVTSQELARLVEAVHVFTADQVDLAAQPTTKLADVMRLPDSLGANATPGGVIAEFVVDSSGQVEPTTINVVAASAAVYAAAVRAALSETGFSPAVRRGRAVRQLVQLRVRFELPASAPGRR